MKVNNPHTDALFNRPHTLTQRIHRVREPTPTSVTSGQPALRAPPRAGRLSPNPPRRVPMSRSYRLASAAGILPKCYTRPVQRSAPLNAPLNAPFASRRLRAVPKQPHRSTPRRKWLNDVRDALSSSLDRREEIGRAY